ncbi:hypothetical protein QQS21_002184 [Conoideocrella luteorostrata]|uniref:J domain-containing protein n=1 Tax=Conoideocrella luteorostrata TaxID=1105319 RepID=A0AAJ0CYG1_9HYPO|nr:hypothetical protein QQS21_002184 [Conoideocrella luteorostrata]
MPVRLAARRAIQPTSPITCSLFIPCSRPFNTSPRIQADFATKNHYERLNIRQDASPGEIKKSFYSLSKSHHPDVNRFDPNAAQNFSLISESYTILSDPSRRAQYDRDVLRLHAQNQPSHPRGSYHSSNPAGGRSPSGLSRRRGTFRGPPPSFYRNGGWGAQGDKRQKAHAESTSTRDSQESTQGPWGNSFAQQYGGMGPGSNPFGANRKDDTVPHFDKEGHIKTHQREDERRWQRRAMGDDDVEFEPQTSLAGHFFIVAGILGATFIAPLVYLQVVKWGKQKERN